MKKRTIFKLMTAAMAVFLFSAGCNSQGKSNEIIDYRVSGVGPYEHGYLYSVVFVQEGDTFALDFLTQHEFDSLKQVLNDFEQRKGNAGSVER